MPRTPRLYRVLRGVLVFVLLIAVVTSSTLTILASPFTSANPSSSSESALPPLAPALQPGVPQLSVLPQLAGPDAPLGSVAQVSAGARHACALLQNGIIQCWGNGADLGAGMVADSSRPLNLDASPPMRYRMVSGKGETTCGLTFDLKVECWGSNQFGMLGNGSGDAGSVTPVPVTGLVNVLSISVGVHTACALSIANRLDCWGSNVDGLLGVDPGELSESNVPVRNSLVAYASQFDVGDENICITTAEFQVQCWGNGDNGVLGAFVASGPAPQTIPDQTGTGILENVTAIAVGNKFACARRLGGALCWGNNEKGSLGSDGPNASFSTPQSVVGMSDGVLNVFANGQTACAIQLGGAKCWGDNSWTKTGTGESVAPFLTAPRQVAGMYDGVTGISIGGTLACASLENGRVKCWGSNDDLQLGMGDNEYTSLPVRVKPDTYTNATAVSAGYDFTCVVHGSDTRCFGAGTSGQLGTGSLVDTPIGAPIAGMPDPSGISAGFAHVCAQTLLETYCWGAGGSGRLGDDSTDQRNTPTEPWGVDAVAMISAGWYHSCAYNNSGALCWGEGNGGRLGNGDTTDKLTPTYVTDLSSNGDLFGISAGGDHSCAIIDTDPGAGVTKTAKCWGFNSSGQVGDGTVDQRNTPVNVSDMADGVTAIHAGSGFTCAIKGNLAWCWGGGQSGQLGNGVDGQSNVPVQVLNSNVSMQLSTGDSHACNIDGGGSVNCWGSNYFGQLGNETDEHSNVAKRVTGLPTDAVFAAGGPTVYAISISAGGTHTCATLNTGELWCWGGNQRGQLGVLQGSVPQSVVSGETAPNLLEVSYYGRGSVETTPVGISGCEATPCWSYFAPGTNLTITITPHYSYYVEELDAQCVSQSIAAGTCTVVMNANTSLQFSLQDKPELEIDITGSGTVSTQPDGIVNCDSDCNAYFMPGTVVTVTATADAGYAFKNWTGACTGNGPCSVTMTTDRNLTANFVKTHLLTVTKSGTGSGTVTSTPAGINCGGACSATYDEGTFVTLTASPDSGSTSGVWSGACTGASLTCDVSMTQARTVDITFVKNTVVNPQSFALNVSKSGTGNGEITSSPAGINCGVACSATFAQDTVVTLTASPANGSIGGQWGGACTGTGVTCVVTMSQARQVTKSFLLNAVEEGKTYLPTVQK